MMLRLQVRVPGLEGESRLERDVTFVLPDDGVGIRNRMMLSGIWYDIDISEVKES